VQRCSPGCCGAGVPSRRQSSSCWQFANTPQVIPPLLVSLSCAPAGKPHLRRDAAGVNAGNSHRQSDDFALSRRCDRSAGMVVRAPGLRAFYAIVRMFARSPGRAREPGRRCAAGNVAALAGIFSLGPPANGPVNKRQVRSQLTRTGKEERDEVAFCATGMAWRVSRQLQNDEPA
jgi:hypothetical protein